MTRPLQPRDPSDASPGPPCPTGYKLCQQSRYHQLISLHDLFQRVLLCLLEEFLSRIDKLLEAVLLLRVLGHVEFLVEWPDLLFEFRDSCKGLLHRVLKILLFNEMYHRDDVIHVLLVGSRAEGDQGSLVLI